MLQKACPRCKRMIPYGLDYCDTCAPIAAAQAEEARERKAEFKRRKYNREYNRRRDPKRLEFYRSKEWKITSKVKLQQGNYRCEARLPGCTGLAVEVHHIRPISTPDGWERRLDWDNLEALCTACHNGRHQRFSKKNNGDVVDFREILKEI